VILLASVLVLGIVLGALSLGKYPLGIGDVLAGLWGALRGSELEPGVEQQVIFQVRLPRVAAALLVGAALAMAGATYQGMFRNPLVSPDILGVSSGAGFGAVLAIFLALPAFAIQISSFVGGLVAVAVVYSIARAVRSVHEEVLVLVLAGIIIGTLFGAGVSLLTYLADPYDQLPAITFWLLGSLAATRPEDLWAALPSLLLGLIPLVLLRWRVNLMSLGDEEAQALGVDTRMVRLALIVSATLMSAAAVSLAGMVGWVGLVVPHLARMLVGPNYSRLLPASMVLGAGYLLLVDTLARTAAEIEIPLGVLNAVVGAPFFLWLLARSRRSWS
jgi:iron complex transport system permease protein